MKVIRLMLWMSVIAVTMMTMTVLSCVNKTTNNNDVQVEDSLNVDCTWESASFFPYYISFMTSRENSLGDSCYWMVYNDIDAGFDNAIISMDRETFTIIKEMWDISVKCDHYCANQYNAQLLKMMDEYDPVIYNDKGTAVLLLSDKD